jgi:hypothetical protein
MHIHIHIHIHTHIHLHTCSFAFTFIYIHIYIVRTVRCWQCICHDMKEFIYIYSLIQPCLIIEVHVLLKILLNIYIIAFVIVLFGVFHFMYVMRFHYHDMCSDSYVLFVSYAVCLDVFHLKIMMPTGCLHNSNFNDKASCHRPSNC